MDFKRAIEHALNGEAILFVGAGFSVGALNQKNESLKTAGELAKLLSSEIGISHDILPLDDAAEEYLEELGEGKLIDLLKREFTVSKTTDSQRIIAQIPWRRIYTTNYDNVIELACSDQNGRTISSVSLSDKIRDLPKDSICVHLNGCITHLNYTTIRDEIKLTDTSYLTSNVADSDWAKLFRQDLNIARAVFFVGYSIADLDIRRILFDQKLLQPKTFFIIGKTPDTRTIRRVSKFGNISKMDTYAFAQAITEIQNVYVPPKETELAWYCFESTKDVINSTENFSDRDFLNLLAYGHFAETLIVKSIYQGISYFCERSRIQHVLELLENNIRYIVVHAELGNGKTLFLEGVKIRALERGYEIFSLIRRSENIYKEVDQISKQASKILLIIENYYDWFDVIDYIGMHNFPNLKVVFSARTPVHDLTVDALISGLDTNDISDISVDYLDEFEINWIINIFDEYGLWGKHAAWSYQHKKDHLIRKCQSQFHAALLSIIEAPQILDRLTNIIERLQQRSQYFEVVISILVLSVLGRTIRLSILYELWGHRIHDATFRRDTFLREIIDFETDNVQVRSSITAKYILTKIADTNIVIDTLIEMVRVMNDLRNIDRQYDAIRIELIRFSQIQNLLPERGRLTAVVRYYESIKSFVEVREHPLFWLQFAVACVTLQDFDRAESLFDTAYSLAEKRDRATHQIDNHYARYLLERSIDKKDISLGFTDFRTARRILNNQMALERRHYPYRIAILYRKFYEVFEPQLNDKSKKEITNAAKHVLNQINKLGENYKKNRYIRQCEEEMEYLLLLIESSENSNENS